jgi:two-component SAPR family response regulator
MLKNLKPMQNPTYAVLMGHTFWLIYSEKAEQIQARTLVKTIEEAQKLVERLQQQGIQAKIYTWYDPKTGKNYYVVQLNGTNIARAAQLYPELRPALKELIQKHNIQPKTPLLRRLLELAENPPLPIEI